MCFGNFLPSQENIYNGNIELIRTTVKSENSELHHLAYNRLAYIVDSFGPRMWGSKSMALALEELY